MSLHYIIDGYNVIKQVDFLTGQKLRAGRDSLMHFIEKHQLHGSKKNEVTVVFDGKAEVESPQVRSAIKVIFSKNESADDKIKRIVEQSRNPKRIVVVSDDKAIKFYCRAVGSRVSSVKEFLEKSSRHRQAEEVDEDEKLEPDSQAALKITEHLKGIWLDRK
ncbi:MAG: NYN domain-containing protein [Candidatus Omnitrophica bacterium]|nr:NYN domain-containing protein [Candidatus Omnitrophota bacterium]